MEEEDFNSSLSHSKKIDLQRNIIVMCSVLIICLILVLGLLGFGSYILYNNLQDDNSSDNSPATSNDVIILTSSNPKQLCSVLPSGNDINARGESIYPIPNSIVENMILNGTWHEGCPVPLEDLTLLYLPYWNCDKNIKETGEMIVHKNVSNEIIYVFNQLYLSGYPLYKMELMYKYGGNDTLSMSVNNTSSFNCREKTNQPGTFSIHSYGMAIDVNPLINPYVNGNITLPEEGIPYVNRSIVIPGTIIGNGGVCYESFLTQGWSWGGDWTSYVDYQHFEIQPNITTT